MVPLDREPFLCDKPEEELTQGGRDAGGMIRRLLLHLQVAGKMLECCKQTWILLYGPQQIQEPCMRCWSLRGPLHRVEKAHRRSLRVPEHAQRGQI